jgi:hypothetical protein
MLHQLRPDSPLRPVDWKWKKVIAYRDAGRRIPRSKYDRETYDLFTFASRVNSCSNDFECLELSEEYPLFMDSYELYKGGNNLPVKYELEARLLTKESYQSIAKKTAISEDLITTYEQTFFNVKDRLVNRSWVVNVVIGQALQHGMSDGDYNILWKIYAYLAGPIMLDMVTVRVGLKEQEAANFDQAVSLMRDSIDVQAILRASQALSIVPINGFTAAAIVDIEQKYREMAKETAGAASTQSFLGAVDKIMSSLPWAVGTGTVEHPVLSCMRESDNQAAELRCSEMLEVASTKKAIEDLKDIRLPEPEDRRDGNKQTK